jgi:hypothetical protein
MASYTSEQLYGKGVEIEALTAATSYTFTLTTPSGLEGNAYFTLESVRDVNGFYVGKSANAVGNVGIVSGTHGLIQSSYIFSVIVASGGGSFTFIPTSSIPSGGAFLRATGGMSLAIS